MKIELTKTTAFVPVSITFTLETQDELDALGTMFNTAPVTDTLRELGKMNPGVRFYDTFVSAGANVNNATTFCAMLREHFTMNK